ALVVIVWGIRSVRSEKDLLEERLVSIDSTGQQFTLDLGEDELETPRDRGGSVLRERLDNVISDRQFAQSWKQQLARADLKLKVSEFAALHVVFAVGGFLLGYAVLFSGSIVLSIVAGFVGFFVPRIYVGRRIQSRLIKFENQLPDTLSLWVNALRSGYSVPQAMEAISRDAPEPTSTEFKRVVQENQLGIDMNDALGHLLNRVESEDLDLVITAVNIQREVGGNLAEILEVIGHTIRERIKIKGEIRVLTSQGRITGYLISGLPIVLALFLYVINPSYMGGMFENRTCGWPMLGIGLALIGIGMALVQKIVDIDI
ncbi:MAG TPA: type II secretion system F family protein, partial [Candidatus Limnocylindrales bacterium]|nr:type II secretion system F family protein [Candidatus Limnocylindrales bacterium]